MSLRPPHSASGVTVAVIVVPRPVQHGGVRKYHAENALIADQPVAALITDLKQRGLLDETLVVWAGEMGMGVVENRHAASVNCGGPRQMRIVSELTAFCLHQTKKASHDSF